MHNDMFRVDPSSMINLSFTSTLLVANLQVAIKGGKSHDNLKNQLYNGAFVRDPFTPPDMSNIDFHGDRRYFSENAFIGIMLLTGCIVTCTFPIGVWLSFVYGYVVHAKDEKRLVSSEEGMMTCEVREKNFKSGDREIDLAIVAFCTGTGKVVLVASSAFRQLTMDSVTTTDKMGQLWKNDQKALTKLGFSLEYSITSSAGKSPHSKVIATGTLPIS